MTNTCATGCRFAEPNENHQGHFECSHPAIATILTAMWAAPGFPEDDGKLPENTPLPVSGTKWLGHPTDCKAWSDSRTDSQDGEK